MAAVAAELEPFFAADAKRRQIRKPKAESVQEKIPEQMPHFAEDAKRRQARKPKAESVPAKMPEQKLEAKIPQAKKGDRPKT